MELGREDILRRTLDGLEADLDELRDDLLDELEAFEGGVRPRVEALPGWLALSPARVRALLRFPDGSTFADASLGPRAVALAASEVEGFVHTWIGRAGEPALLDVDTSPDLTARHERDLTALRLYLDTLEREAVAVSIAARTSLNMLRDEILAELEEDRRADAETLQELVANGDLEQGKNARAELATLWEEQRRRASTFLTHWEHIDALPEEGLDRTERGLDTLRQLLDNAEAGLRSAAPRLYEPRGGAAPTSPPAAEASTTAPPISDESLRILSGDEVRAPDPREEDANFDPYGDSPPDEPEIDREQSRRAKRERFLALAPDEEEPAGEDAGRDFFDDPEEFDDNLVFADREARKGPMIDFFADEGPADEAQEFFSPVSPTDAPGGATPERSPYDVFLSEDSSPTEDARVEALPHLAPPAEAPRAEEPSTELETIPPRAVASPGAREEQAAGRAARGDEVADVAHPTQPIITPRAARGDEVADVAHPTQPIITPRAAPPEDSGEHPTILDTTRGEDDAGPTAPLLELPAASAPEATPDVPVLEEEAPLEDEPRVGDTSPATSRPDTPPAPRPPEAPAPAPALAEEDAAGEDEERAIEAATDASEGDDDLEQALEVEPTTTTRPLTRAPLHVEGMALRVRAGAAPVSTAELALAFGAPLLVELALLALAWRAATPADNPLLPGSLTQVLALALLSWLALGPWVLRWRVRWRGWRPQVLRQAQLRDEAELLVSDEALELGPWQLPLADVTEVSRARWESPMDETRGWLLTVVDREGEVWSFVSAASEASWRDAPWPITTAPVDGWQVDEETLQAIDGWARR